MVFQNNVLSGAAGSSTPVYGVDQSIRFNSADSAYMYRTPSSASNRKTFTISFWFKTTVSGSFQTLIGAYDNSSATDSTYFGIWQGSTGNMGMGTWNTNQISTTRKIRDPSAWFHCVYAIDTTDTLSTDRVKLYINGQRETDITYNAPSLNHDFGWNLNQVHSIGRINYLTGSGPYYTNGYLTEIYHIDGQALDCNSFGEFNSSGIWIPKDASGLTFGTNGFYIDGRDASDLGDDESGQGNDYTVSGLAAHDQVFDTPTNNFPTLNPLHWGIRNAANSVPLSEGNLKFTGSNSVGVYGTYYTTIEVPSSGGWYFEMRVTSIGSVDKDDMYLYVAGINFFGDGSVTGSGSYGSAWSAGDILGVAVNATGIWLSINGTYQNSGNPVTGSNSAGTPSTTSREIITGDGSATTNSSLSGILNFGQDSTFAGATSAGGNSDASGVGNFKYSVPSGFKALCTKNMGA
jgi:hypothetical protein